jgi:hypothetical protein
MLNLDGLDAEGGEGTLLEWEARPALAPDPFWEWFKCDPRWQTDRWILQTDAAEKRDSKA